VVLEQQTTQYLLKGSAQAIQAVSVSVLSTTSDIPDESILSFVGTVDDNSGTIVDVPMKTLENFKNNIQSGPGTLIEVYEQDGTTRASYIATGFKVIVKVNSGSTSKTYTLTVNPSTFDLTGIPDVILAGGVIKAGSDSGIKTGETFSNAIQVSSNGS